MGDSPVTSEDIARYIISMRNQTIELEPSRIILLESVIDTDPALVPLPDSTTTEVDPTMVPLPESAIEVDPSQLTLPESVEESPLQDNLDLYRLNPEQENTNIINP